MTRQEFMRELGDLLWDVPREEREEALKYYEGYFDDAGRENEDAVVGELGSPKRIAALIKKDLKGGRFAGDGEYTEHGYQEGRESGYEVAPKGGNGKHGAKGLWENDATKVCLIVLLCVLAFPFLTGTFGLVLGLVGTLIGLLLACVAIAFSFTVAGIALVAFGFFKLFFSLPWGIFIMGFGFLMLGVGILTIYLNLWLWNAMLPSLFRWSKQTIKGLRHGKGANS